MAQVPVVIPDGEKIGQLIWNRGYSRADFARTLRLTKVQTLYNIVNQNQRAKDEVIDEIAEALGVKPEEIVLSRVPYPRKLAS